MFSIIVACDKNKGIGKNGSLPWKLKGDMKYFSETTKKTTLPNKKNAVIMGRKTYESIPEKFRPLPDRRNIVVTRNNFYNPENPDVVVCYSLDEALEKAKSFKDIDKTFVIGGGDIYKQALLHEELTDVYLTKIFEDFDCDTFIQISFESYQTIEVRKLTEKNIIYSISHFRKSSYCL